MSNALGALSYPRGEEHPFLGRKLATEKNFSDKTAWIIDQEIRNLVTQAEKCAAAIVSENRSILKELAELLVAEETLERAAFEDFIEARKPVRPDGACAEAMPVAFAGETGNS
jgi:cell division protease FtsH